MNVRVLQWYRLSNSAKIIEEYPILAVEKVIYEFF